MRSPIIAVSLNYRLAAWGFMYGQEVVDASITNLGLRDQRLALHWIRENINAFGGDPNKVTIWGESAGAHSVGVHLVAYGGRDDKLFRAAISESGAPAPYTTLPTVSSWQPIYNAITNATKCSSSVDTLDCLRKVPSDTLSAIFNGSVTGDATYLPAIDGDFLRDSGTTQLRKGQFVKVPYLIGANFDEGGQFDVKGINTTNQFLALVKSAGPDNATAATIAALYPDIPDIGIPATLKGRPSPSILAEYGYQWKRSAAYEGDLWMHAGRRLASQSWAINNVSTWSYHFNVLVNGISPLIGAAHFQEVALVMNNIQGLGYETAVAVNPFANEPLTFPRLAKIMSRMWISFISELDPNYNGAACIYWPKYTFDQPQNIVFDSNVTALSYIEPDIYRAEGIAYIISRLDTVYQRSPHFSKVIICEISMWQMEQRFLTSFPELSDDVKAAEPIFLGLTAEARLVKGSLHGGDFGSLYNTDFDGVSALDLNGIVGLPDDASLSAQRLDMFDANFNAL
ncbi:hypothetical protein V491_08170 [Pseudogymnoascus sp. VKM F-3775]|nr:hypothetical protein V491_08170 [Pseudogymnoascus sp. VKM F-3775]